MQLVCLASPFFTERHNTFGEERGVEIVTQVLVEFLNLRCIFQAANRLVSAVYQQANLQIFTRTLDVSILAEVLKDASLVVIRLRGRRAHATLGFVG